MFSGNCKRRTLLSVFLRFSFVWAGLVNRTIDDEVGDSVSGEKLVYYPPDTSGFKQGNNCTGCLIHLDTSLVDLCFDTGHYAYGGGQPLAFMRDNLEAIGYLHLKDVDATILAEAREQGWSFLEALEHVIFCPLGDGSARIPEILTLLNDSNFAGWVVVEQDTCHGDPTAVARQNRNYIARQVGEA